ncbi:Gamma-glutamylputrescine oxidoreductase [Roseovarius albus]|uniref:Gamma-glutamylputrescine oxidoreductase n=1 Tax=Roseovarius albus TaxID=1247867 RepID=A0A1X6ZIV6_9RHOB|nr:FAD-dependent oxidoreductase [Roseovarius albus]SLN52915.1 Gamma-glutamylputrescine oxidoreductase [Roseovarius albus]
MKINRLPKDDKTNGWSAILPGRTPHDALKGDINADWVVLGAGYAGLAAARRLAENCPDQNIVVIEAGQTGENASGRNSGFAIDLPHNVGSSLEELEGSHRFMRLARSAIDHLEGIVTSHNISCDWARAGKYHTAVSSRGRRDVLEPFAKEMEALNEPYEWIEGDALEKRLGSPHFTAAVYTPGCALMNPAALVRGLADTLPENVTLYENSPVIEANFQNGVQLTTTQGSIRAPKMIMGANGFSDQFGFYNRRFLHLVAHASLTRPLTEKEQAEFGVHQQWGLTPANAFAGITMRYTADHRILIRQGLSYCPSQRVSAAEQEAVRRRHIALFKDRFPSIADVDMDHTWSGFVCLSRNGAPGFGQLAPNIWSAVCQNAVGVTKGTFGGILAADMATGRDNPLIADMQTLGEPDMLPPRPFLDVGVRARFGWELWSNRHEA